MEHLQIPLNQSKDKKRLRNDRTTQRPEDYQGTPILLVQNTTQGECTFLKIKNPAFLKIVLLPFEGLSSSNTF